MTIQYDSNGIITQNLTEIINERETNLQPVMGEGKNAGGNSQMRYPTMVPPVAGQIYFQTID